MSPYDRLTSDHAALLVVDVQEKLIARIPDRDLVVFNTVRLIEGARHLEIPAIATEQYPQGLGPSVPEICERIEHRPSKFSFHCASVPELSGLIESESIRHITLAGIEAHICVLQTALELLKLGLRVQVAADAVASRGLQDMDFALRRMERLGVTVSTTEAILFEWTGTAKHPQFKAISALVKDRAPAGRLETPG